MSEATLTTTEINKTTVLVRLTRKTSTPVRKYFRIQTFVLLLIFKYFNSQKKNETGINTRSWGDSAKDRDY